MYLIFLGFSIMGNFVSKLPNDAALKAAEQLIEEFKRRNYVNRNCWSFYGHRDKGNTTCPGDALYAHFQSWENWHNICTNQ